MPQKFKRKALHLNSSLTANAVITNKSIYGADHIVVEGAGSIIADTVMNGIFYPKDEVIALANRTKSDLHAPSGHPTDESGNFISASHPMATQQNFIGGISNNYRMNGDRLVRDIAINPEIANRFDDGKEIIRRIENEEDTDTSTGLLLHLEETSGIGADGEPYKFIARNMELDHDAILLRERGAATSLQGVGMFANSKGDEFKVDEYTINASIPAMSLPLAPNDHAWNESEALTRIKTFTNSTDKPSSNFRRFFLNFDQSNVDSFDSYTNLFADVIDGVPHAVKAPIEAATNNTNAKAYSDRFVGNGGFKKTLSDKLDKLFAWIGNSGYTIDEQLNTDNNNGDRIMRKKVIAALNAKGVKTEGLDDDAIFAAYEKLNKSDGKGDEGLTKEEILKKKKDKDKDKDKKPEHNGLTLEDVTTAVNAAIKPLQEQLTANSAKELDELAEQVEKLDIGITKEAAKTMGVNSCQAILARNGVAAFSSGGGYIQHNTQGDSLKDLEMPMKKES